MYIYIYIYRRADKSLARSTSRYILFDGENISFDASLVIYINSTNITPIMIINKYIEYNRAKDLSAPLYIYTYIYTYRDADKSLARPGRKQATATENFDVHITYL